MGLRLVRIAGIDVHADWSLLIIFFLILNGLALGLFPAWHPDWGAGLAWATALGAALLFFASVLAHELSHALVGRRHGVVIRRITLFVFGGVAHVEREPQKWRAELWMAAVGPLTSLALGLAFLFAAGTFVSPAEVDQRDARVIDGGRVLRAILWGATGNLRRATRWASWLGQAFAWILIATGLAMMLGLRVPVFGGGLVGGLWLAFIGWFLNNAALMSYRQLLTR
jgi:Zn-dependent protease